MLSGFADNFEQYSKPDKNPIKNHRKETKANPFFSEVSGLNSFIQNVPSRQFFESPLPKET